jgi:hypothetical protein
MRSPIALALFAAALGCDDPAPEVDAGPPDAAAADASAEADAGRDGGADAGPPSCAEALADRRVALDRSGVLTQIHPAVAWDGEAIWVTFVRPEEGGDGGFDVYATRVGCDGRRLVEPFAVQSDPSGNDIDPALAIAGDRVLIAWQTDDGTGGTDNLQVRYRLFDRDGTPRGEDRTLRTRYEGAPVGANHMGVKVAGLPDGRFAVAGSRALPATMRFSAYVQRLAADGSLDGEALDPSVEMEVGQTAVAVDATPGGDLWVAYDRQPDGGEAAVTVHRFAPERAPEPALERPAVSSGADLLATADAVWAAFAGGALETDLRLVDVSVPLAERAPAVLGESGRVEHSPRLARAEDGAMALAFFRQIRGFDNELHVARFTPGAPGAPPTVGETVRADRIGAPSYQPALTHVRGDFWFVAFAEGESPDFRLVGRFVELPS